MSEYTHAYVQYYIDKKTDVINISHFVNCHAVKKGKKAEVKWFNEATKKHEIHEAYIHFLGTSEDDIDSQIEEFENSHSRLKLPPARTLSLESNDSDDDLPSKEKKAKMSLAKIKVKEEILNEHKNKLLQVRKNLSFGEEIEMASTSGESQKFSNKEINDDMPKEREKIEKLIPLQEKILNIDNNNLVKHQKNDDDINSKVVSRPVITSNVVIRQGENAENVRRQIENSESEMGPDKNAAPVVDHVENVRPEIQQNERFAVLQQQNHGKTKAVKRIKLKKYDTFNDQMYLGGGILLLTEDWNYIKGQDTNGKFIRSLATCILVDDLKGMCLDETRAGPRDEEGAQVRTKIPNKMIRAMEELYKDRLKKQGAKGKKKLNEMASKVRMTLTRKINELNKIKDRRVRIRDDESDEDDGLVEVEE